MNICGADISTRAVEKSCERCGAVFTKTPRYSWGRWNRMRFCSRASTNCWEWRGASASGYGVFFDGNRMIGAHRFSYELLVDPIPDGLCLDHLCRNRICVNPWHLEPVTMRENLLRGEGLSAENARKTHCKRGHALEDANVYMYRGQRRCRRCGVLRAREKRLRRVP